MKRIYVILFIFFSFLLLPSFAFACKTSYTNKSEKNYCKKHSNTLTKKGDCNSNHSKNRGHYCCSGKCKHSKCACTSLFKKVYSINVLVLNNSLFEHTTIKQKFFNKEIFWSSEYYSLWFIPKIS